MEVVHHYRRRRAQDSMADAESSESDYRKPYIINKYKLESTQEIKRKCDRFYTNEVNWEADRGDDERQVQEEPAPVTPPDLKLNEHKEK